MFTNQKKEKNAQKQEYKTFVNNTSEAIKNEQYIRNGKWTSITALKNFNM